MTFGTISRFFCFFRIFLAVHTIISTMISTQFIFSENIRELLKKIIKISPKNNQNPSTKVGMKFHFISFHSAKKKRRFLLKYLDLSGAKECKSCRSRKMLQNESLVDIVAVDTAENEPLQVWGVIQFNIQFGP